MREVTVDRDDLRAIVEKNRENHRQVFERAMEEFKKAAHERLDKHLKMLGRGEVPPLHLGLVVPEDHTDDGNERASIRATTPCGAGLAHGRTRSRRRDSRARGRGCAIGGVARSCETP